jgi:hypothetical protein
MNFYKVLLFHWGFGNLYSYGNKTAGKIDNILRQNIFNFALWLKTIWIAFLFYTLKLNEIVNTNSTAAQDKICTEKVVCLSFSFFERLV